MSLWLDFLGAEISFVDLASFGKTRVAFRGNPDNEALFMLHGIGGHLEAYAKNIVALSNDFFVVAFDFVGHGLSNKPLNIEYIPDTYAEQLLELMKHFGIEKANITGESLGGWVTGHFAAKYPQHTKRIILNTAAGMPVVSEKGFQDLKNLAELSKKSASLEPSFENVEARMKWLMHPNNWQLLNEELINTRLFHYSLPDARVAAPYVQKLLRDHANVPLVKYEDIEAETLFLWTRDNPIHDVEAAKAACARTPNGKFYLMEHDAVHWPQYEAPQEFNEVVRTFLNSK